MMVTWGQILLAAPIQYSPLHVARLWRENKPLKTPTSAARPVFLKTCSATAAKSSRHGIGGSRDKFLERKALEGTPSSTTARLCDVSREVVGGDASLTLKVVKLLYEAVRYRWCHGFNLMILSHSAYHEQSWNTVEWETNPHLEHTAHLLMHTCNGRKPQLPALSSVQSVMLLPLVTPQWPSAWKAPL